MKETSVRSIIWSSIKAGFLAVLLAAVSPAAAQYYDIYGDANRLLPAAQEAYDATPSDADTGVKAARASDLIMGLIGKAKYKEAYEFYLKNQDLPIHPDAVAGAVGHGLVAFVEDKGIQQDYIERLKQTAEAESCTPCYARTFAAHHLGRYYFNIESDLVTSVQWHKRALDLAKADLAPTDPARVNFAYQYASYLRNLDLQAAGKAVRETEAMALKLLPSEDHLGWLYVFLNNALVALDKQRFAQAADLFGRIADIGVKEWGEDDPQLLGIYQNTAVLLSRSGQSAQAVEVAKRAIAAEGYSNDNDLGYHRALIARLLVADERPDEAVPYYREALRYFASAEDDNIDKARAQSDLADLLSLQGQHDEALSLIAKAVPVYQAKFPVANAQRRIRERIAARIYAKSGDVARAVEALNPVLEYNENVLLDIYARDQDRIALAADGVELFEDSMAIALLDGDLERAWRSAQLAMISDLAVAAKALTYPGDPAGFSAALEAVNAARTAEDEARARLASEQSNAAQLANAREARELAEETLKASYPDFAEFLRPQPLTIAEGQELLREDEAYILPVVFDDKVVTIALAREGLFWGSATTDLFAANRLIASLRASLESGLSQASAFDAQAAHRLYSLIFTPPVEAATREKTKFIFPSSGALSRVPPSVLVTQRPQEGDTPTFLIERHAVAITADLGARSRQTSSSGQRFAGIGAPSLGEPSPMRFAMRGAQVDIENLKALPSLPRARDELEALKAAFEADEALLLTGEDATETSVRAAPLQDYQVLAFATHGLVSGQIDGLSEPALVMTPMEGEGGQAEDGLLTASEIAQLKLAADWIILSACNTAAGDGRGNAVYSGLARAFQLAGARSLLLSHWPVRDDAATRLSVATVTAAAKGVERSEALRQAQLALIADSEMEGSASPSIWAPFVLIE